MNDTPVSEAPEGEVRIRKLRPIKGRPVMTEQPPEPARVVYPPAEEVVDGREVIHPETGQSITRQLYINVALPVNDPRWPDLDEQTKVMQFTLTRGSAEYLAAKKALAEAKAERDREYFGGRSQARKLAGHVTLEKGPGVKEEFDTVSEAARILGILPANLYTRIRREIERQTKELGYEPEFLDFNYRKDAVRIFLGGAK